MSFNVSLMDSSLATDKSKVISIWFSFQDNRPKQSFKSNGILHIVVGRDEMIENFFIMMSI